MFYVGGVGVPLVIKEYGFDDPAFWTHEKCEKHFRAAFYLEL